VHYINLRFIVIIIIITNTSHNRTLRNCGLALYMLRGKLMFVRQRLSSGTLLASIRDSGMQGSNRTLPEYLLHAVRAVIYCWLMCLTMWPMPLQWPLVGSTFAAKQHCRCFVFNVEFVLRQSVECQSLDTPLVKILLVYRCNAVHTMLPRNMSRMPLFVLSTVSLCRIFSSRWYPGGIIVMNWHLAAWQTCTNSIISLTVDTESYSGS